MVMLCVVAKCGESLDVFGALPLKKLVDFYISAHLDLNANTRNGTQDVE